MTIRFKLTAASLKALKARTGLRFTVGVKVGSTRFTAKVRLKPPKSR